MENPDLKYLRRFLNKVFQFSIGIYLLYKAYNSNTSNGYFTFLFYLILGLILVIVRRPTRWFNGEEF